ncbi:MAG: hypothetical protein AAFP19_00725 [Bacteroidota bacterium]
MKNSQLCGLLKLLNTRERRRFRAYVHSPFFNKHQKTRELGDYLLPFAPDFDQPSLTKKAVFAHLFPDEPYKEAVLNNLISDLLQLLYGYLAYKGYERHPQQERHYLLEELLIRDLPSHFERASRRFRQIQEKTPYRNFQYHHYQYLLHQQLDQYLLSQSKRRYDENLQLESDELDLYYMSNKLRIACDMTSRNRVIKAGYDCQFIQPVIAYYEANQERLSQYPALVVYYTALQLIQAPDIEAHYLQLKSVLNEHGDCLPNAELWTLYNYALNYCILRINSGMSTYYQEVLELYKLLLDRGLLFQNGYLTQWTYKNITTAGLRLKEYDWTRQFIEEFKSLLLPEEQENAYSYNLATFYYAQKAYSAALQQLHDVEFTDTSYHLGAKIIQLKSYYELEETEAFFSLIEAFKKYILRNRELADYRKKANAHFLDLAKRIYRLKINRKTLSTAAYQQRQRSIRERMSELQPIANKNWLEEVFAHL